MLGFDDVGCSPLIETGILTDAECGDRVEIARPSDPNKGTGARGPGQVTAHEGGRMSRRLKFTVIRGGLAALPMQPPQKGVTSARAAGPRLITVDGRRVHQPASA